MQTSKILSFEDVSAGFKDKSLLEKVSFDIHLGEFVYLVGKTGSGKSTLMKLIYADQIAQTGKVIMGDFTPSAIPKKDVPFLRRKLGIVFQDFQLLPEKTAYQNIAFALQASGWKDGEKIKKRIQEVLIKVGMAGKANAMPYQLSGGEQQRIAIARALINDPLLLLADEPTGNLDPEATDNIMEVLQRINLSGTAILMATHEHSLLKKYPSRTLHVTDNRVIDYPQSQDFLKMMYA